ncbi:MAG: methylated-DNA--[protein]-cysteine S-methyltransferase [Holosporales bacterium]|jgi:methylated-DNA-[protein]-cysteine S-methyltransferase|nr:methylated-DNA--[protein]-cysteine S-methyltransferase [Holosporales bacterium]
MKYTCDIDTSLGSLTACAENEALIGVWFVGQKRYPVGTNDWRSNPDHFIFKNLRIWLKDYFLGNYEAPQIPINPSGTTFQKKVWDILISIPFGKTTTYGEIAKILGIKSARAIGSAVGRNPIAILIPCHRVIGYNGKLIGYAGGIDRKASLLRLENCVL